MGPLTDAWPERWKGAVKMAVRGVAFPGPGSCPQRARHRNLWGTWGPWQDRPYETNNVFSLFNPFVVITCSPLNSSHRIRNSFSEVELFVILRPGHLSTRNSCRIYKEGMGRKESNGEKEPRRIEKHVLLDGLWEDNVWNRHMDMLLAWWRPVSLHRNHKASTWEKRSIIKEEKKSKKKERESRRLNGKQQKQSRLETASKKVEPRELQMEKRGAMNLVQMEMNEWEGGFDEPSLWPERGKEAGTPGSRWNGPQLRRGWEDGRMGREGGSAYTRGLFLQQRLDNATVWVEWREVGGGKLYRGLWQTKLLTPNSNIYRLLQGIIGNRVQMNLVKMEDSYREAVEE